MRSNDKNSVVIIDRKLKGGTMVDEKDKETELLYETVCSL